MRSISSFRLMRLAGIVALVLSASPSHARGSGLRLEVDLSDRILQVWDGDRKVTSYDVAVGANSHPTPTGDFDIRHLIWNPRWVPPDAAWARKKSPKSPGDPDNPMKVVKMFFQEPDYYIHGTDASDSLGRAESHGCIRMSETEVGELARLVMEHGGKARPESWFRRIFRRGRPQGVYLSLPVPLSIRK